MMNKIIAILLLGWLSLSSSCGRKPAASNPKPNNPSIADLKAKVKLYESLIPAHQDEHGFILTEHCDATLFSGLLAAAYPGTIDITAAKDDEGTWYRRPGHDCGPQFGNSRSVISRDMMLGAFWGLWTDKNLDVMIELMENLKNNAYFMPGPGDIGTLLMNPSMLNTLAEMIRALGGPEYEPELSYPAIFTKNEGYVNHLTVWHILLRGEVLGSISAANFRVLKSIAADAPQNPLYQAAYHKYLDNDMTNVVKLLLDESMWPSDKLPTSDNFCAVWVIQRDAGENWEPCPEKNRKHTGAELLVVYKLFIEESEDADGPQRVGETD